MSGKRFGIIGALMASAAIGPMTAAERAKGRYMRAPDHEAEFNDFAESGEVEVGESDKSTPAKPAKPAKPARAAQPAKPAAGGIQETKDGEAPEDDDAARRAAEANDDDDDDDGEGEGEGEAENEQPKPKKKASDRIRELTKQLRERDRTISTMDGRLSALEKGGLPPAADRDNASSIGEKPDPTDTAKYPLGHLDERYVEDSIAFGVRRAAAEQADASLQRQQQGERDAEAARTRDRVLAQVDDLATKGSELYDDFQEAVVDTGLKGEWKLEQATFEAAAEADHGPQILYELSRDKAEAARVAALTPFQQMRFVDKRNAEIAAEAKPKTKPSAAAPSKTTTKGGNSRRVIPADTDDLGDFEKAWEADAKG